MAKVRNKLDNFAIALAHKMMAWRWAVIFVSFAIAVLIGMQMANLALSSNYRAFFSKENPELTAFEEFQDTYTKNDNFNFVIVPKDGGDVFRKSALLAAEKITEQGWLVPYASRVDSVTNFQHTYAIGDDLIVEDLIDDAATITDEEIAQKREIALAEPLLKNQLVAGDASALAINVVLQYPELSLEEVPEAVAFVRNLREEIKAEYPDLDVYLSGVSMLNNAFAEASINDFGFLVPMMFLVILVITAVSVRSLSATLSTLLIIILSSVMAMGLAGAAGTKLAGPSPSAPIIILTLAIADSIHILLSFRNAMRDGLSKLDAIADAIRVNFLPVAVTSITTMVGFLSLRFSDSPPFRDLGTITATGIFFAWIFSVTLLPALLSMMPIRVKARGEEEARSTTMLNLANFVIGNYRKLFVVMGALAIAVISFIPTIQLSDQWREYFSPKIEFRAETDAVMPYFGLYPIEWSVPAGETGGVSDPEFLETLDAFAEWLRTQEHVTHVFSFTDIMKRLNKNMNGDDEAFYKLPDDRDLSAQYLLLYELSLPYGLDLNDRINIDKSATRITATVSGDGSTKWVRGLLADADDWFAKNAPQYANSATGAQVMFTFIAQRNVESMVLGTAIAVVAIGLIMMLALRSVNMGLMSIVPNAMPILAAFGVWAILFGEVGFSVAAIAAISLGIVIDDTVHFLTKFMRARREKGLTIANSIRYAFETVGVAIIVNTLIFGAGFMMLTMSTFKINFEMGLLTSITIGLALILDFLFLPPLLLMTMRKKGEDIDVTGETYVQE